MPDQSETPPPSPASSLFATNERIERINVADEIKNSIRDNLPRSLFLPIDRWHFLEILSSADKIADRVEDLGYLLTIRKTRVPDTLRPDFVSLLEKALESYSKMQETVQDFDQLIDAGFTGPVAEKVMQDIDLVCHLEWETDKIGYKLSQHLFEHEDSLSPVDIMMLHDIASALSKFADSVEYLAKQIRRTLARTRSPSTDGKPSKSRPTKATVSSAVRRTIARAVNSPRVWFGHIRSKSMSDSTSNTCST